MSPRPSPSQSKGSPLTSYADDGWVDDSAKIGVNTWGDDHKHDVARRHLEYLSGEIPGISPGYGAAEGPRCAIWNTVATDESEPGRDGFTFDSPPAGGRYFISGSAAATVASRDERLKARLTTWLVDQRRLGNRCPEVTTGSIGDADGDRARGGVYYEAGFAHGLGLPVIFTCRQDVIDDGLIHFDTRQYNHIAWTTPEELRKRLADRIAATIGDGSSEEGGGAGP